MTTQIPTDAAVRSNTPVRRQAGAVKRDINLLPADEASQKRARRGLIALACIIGVLLLAYVGIVLPSLSLRGLQALADGKAADAAALQGADKEFNSLVEQRNSLSQTLKSMEAFGKEYRPAADAIKEIGDACPGSVTLLAVTLSQEGAAIRGRAPDEKDVAQFIVNLSALPEYASVELVSTGADTGESAAKSLTFELNAKLPQSAPASPSPQPEPTPASDGKGGDGK